MEKWVCEMVREETRAFGVHKLREGCLWLLDRGDGTRYEDSEKAAFTLGKQGGHFKKLKNTKILKENAKQAD